MGNFHSHPASPSKPSAEDIRFAFDANLSYAILSLENIKNPVFNSFIIKDNDILEEQLIILEWVNINTFDPKNNDDLTKEIK